MSKLKVITKSVPDAWRQLLLQQKTIGNWPDWSKVVSLRSGSKVKTRRDDVHTASAETTEALFLLADENGLGLEGCQLRFTAWAYKRRTDVTAVLLAFGGRNFVAISRLDAWPTTPHSNGLKALKKPGLKHLAADIAGCHVHRFDDNLKYGPEAFGPGPEGNLPVAVAFPNDLQSFRDFLRCVETEFNIDGLENFPGPLGWQGLV